MRVNHGSKSFKTQKKNWKNKKEQAKNQQQKKIFEKKKLEKPREGKHTVRKCDRTSEDREKGKKSLIETQTKKTNSLKLDYGHSGSDHQNSSESRCVLPMTTDFDWDQPSSLYKSIFTTRFSSL